MCASGGVSPFPFALLCDPQKHLPRGPKRGMPKFVVLTPAGGGMALLPLPKSVLLFPLPPFRALVCLTWLPYYLAHCRTGAGRRSWSVRSPTDAA